MDIKLTEKDRIKVLNVDDLFAIMQKVLLRENKIDQDKEHFWIVGLDAERRILFIELVALGGVTSTTVKPTEVFRVAVIKNAVSAILIHNHTTANVAPSDADKDLTDFLIQVGRILNVPVFDHLIISARTFFSFGLAGLMEELRASLKWVPPYEIKERIRMEEARIREEAVQAAKIEAAEQGMRKGLREGREEGREMGREEGREDGLQEGERKGRKEMAKVLLADGVAIDVISKASGLSEKEVREWGQVQN